MSVGAEWVARAVSVVKAVDAALGLHRAYSNGTWGPSVRWRDHGTIVAEVLFAAPFGEHDDYGQALIDAPEK